METSCDAGSAVVKFSSDTPHTYANKTHRALDPPPRLIARSGVGESGGLPYFIGFEQRNALRCALI
jgi:hypothetical protein